MPPSSEPTATPEYAPPTRTGDAWLESLRSALGGVLVGQRELVDSLIIGLLTGGHILLEGVPGLAK
ncbi:MAG: ATPase, partial [Planctomycetota bacterium]|nr:ATPase [Planctomycetota bacterium]